MSESAARAKKILELEVSGIIDENFQFPEIVTEGLQELILHLKGVRAINSIGVRNWITWRKQLDGRIQIILKECSPALIDQINILEGFLPLRAEVHSFMAPMACSKCGWEVVVLLEQGKDFEKETRTRPCRISAPLNDCPKCSGTMEFDVVAEKYFRFLTRK